MFFLEIIFIFTKFLIKYINIIMKLNKLLITYVNLMFRKNFKTNLLKIDN